MTISGLLVWILYFIVPMQVSYLILENHKKHSYLARNSISGFVFIIFSSIIVLTRYPILSKYISFTPQSFLVFILMVVFSFYLTNFFSNKLRIDSKITKLNTSPYFLTFTKPFLFTKLSDIIFQQLMIVLLLNILVSSGMALNTIIVIFMIVFSSLHALTVTKHKMFGLYFLVFSLLGSFLFPILILQIPGGFYYSLSIHLFFYIFGRAMFGEYYNLKNR